ncbi:hypothetical protein NEMBOFW57_000104 [Staphylotrichum longicolle]|uniref:Heterokaryon incompatibility domain-containing protein n=1 Tax=Staphylotrichum longicolle TaxID=669026 RepID=A0AAD4EZH6_9PEZI|nr:hypothetical protein NEMBOFW57_000104 [Staphylotrichum longicolle]
MRLINTSTLALQEFHNPTSTPAYAILSHTWSENPALEVTFQQFIAPPHTSLAENPGFAKITQTCLLAREKGLDWAWVDTCCIDKSSSAELTEAINSMWRWYAGAEVCFAFLEDWEDDSGAEEPPMTETTDERVAQFARCRWFTRGWTLQELIAPCRVEFYNRRWAYCGDKSSLITILSGITRICTNVLASADGLPTVPVAQRMSWAARRRTTRLEDAAYCLLGIFGINMPLLYGEGDKAFIRLQEEIIKESNDLTLFAWVAQPDRAAAQVYWGILAPSPREFEFCDEIETRVDPMHANECTITSKGVRVTPVHGGGLRIGTGKNRGGTYGMSLHCYARNSPRQADLGISLQQLGCDVYTRVRPDVVYNMPPRSDQDKARVFYVSKTVSPSRSVMMRASIGQAISLSRALEVLSYEYGIRPARSGAFWPEGHWDGQRRVFLTKGVGDFQCYVKLINESLGGKQMLLMCSMVREGGDTVGVEVRITDYRLCDGG